MRTFEHSSVHGITELEVYEEPLNSQYKWITGPDKFPVMEDTVILV